MAGICPNGRKGGKEAEGVGKGGDRLETTSGARLQRGDKARGKDGGAYLRLGDCISLFLRWGERSNA